MTARAIVAAFAATIVGGCSDVGPAGVPASISFDALPAPAVVLGDTLRNADGLAVQLSASVFDARNNQIPDAPVEFLALNDGIRITEDRYVIAESHGDTVLIVAQAGALQTPPVRLVTVQRPGMLRAVADTEIVIEYDPLTAIPSAAMRVRVLAAEPATVTDTVVPNWRVDFAVTGQAPGDTVPGYLVATNTRARASADTTGPDGVASVQYFLRPRTLTVLTDTLEVLATARHRGEPLAGSPVRFLLIIRPRPAS